MMEIFQVFITNDVESKISLCDAIEYEGKLWLVPEWIGAKGGTYRSPARIIRFDNLSYAPVDPKYPARYVLRAPVPKELLNCAARPRANSGFEIVEAPDIHIQILPEV